MRLKVYPMKQQSKDVIDNIGNLPIEQKIECLNFHLDPKNVDFNESHSESMEVIGPVMVKVARFRINPLSDTPISTMTMIHSDIIKEEEEQLHFTGIFYKGEIKSVPAFRCTAIDR